MPARGLFLCVAFATGLAFAQGAAQFEIRGTVVEGALGIGGVTVTLYEFGHTPAEATTRTVFATTFTDSQGAFVLHPLRAGNYYVEVNKQGYFADSYNGATADPVDSTGDALSIDADRPLQERKFSLMRLGELRGRVVDEDGNPVGNTRVGIHPGRFNPVVTDEDGYFIAANLRPGDYSVSVMPRSPQIRPQFSEEDLKLVDEDLQVSNWPSVPVPVRSGASVSLGNIPLRKTAYYRAHLTVQVSDCTEGEEWMFSTTIGGFGPSVPCGKEFMVQNLAPGSYSFTLATSGRTGERRWGSADAEVKDRNIPVVIAMSGGTDISARLLPAKGVTLPPGNITIAVSQVPRTFLGNQTTAKQPDGQFIIRALPAVHHQLSVNGLTKDFYVKEIPYNGLILSDGIFTPIPGAQGQLDILIDDHAGTIRGSLDGYDKAAARVMVVAVKWPLPAEIPSTQALLNTAAGTAADDQGRFQIGGLVPGEYRVLATTAGDLSMVQPDTVSRAEKVIVERGGSQTISVKIVEP
jgi:hypothetical protein